MKRCFILLRQSVGSNDPDDSLSIEVQEQECIKFAEQHGVEIVDIFKDANTSGRLYPTGYEELAKSDIVYQKWVKETGKKEFRKGLGEALRRLDEVDTVICFDMTRLHRSLNGSFLANLITQKLTVSKVKVLTVKEGTVDFSKFSDTLVNTITSQINSEQLIIQKEKSKASMKKLKDAGEWSCGCFKSFGYKSTGRRREVEIDESKAKYVKMIYEEFLNGLSYYKLMMKVNKGFYSEYHRYIGKTWIIRILRNPIYCGYYKDSNDNLIKSLPNTGKEIIPFDMWEKVQKMLDNNKRHLKRDDVNWLPLRGKIFCGECGEKIGAITETVNDNVCYRCYSYIKRGLTKDFCCHTSVIWYSKKKEGNGLRDAVYPLIMLYNAEKLKYFSASSGNEEKIESLKIVLKNLETKEMKLNRLFIEDSISENAFSASIKDIKNRRDEISEELRNYEMMKSDDEYDENCFLADTSIVNHQDLIQGDAEIALNEVIKKITVYRDKIDIQLSNGGFSLPIKRIGHSRLLPNTAAVYTDDDSTHVVERLYYYYGKLDDVNLDDARMIYGENEYVKIYIVDKD